jgi:drug/metabolite transporter (DMT)-like permease
MTSGLLLGLAAALCWGLTDATAALAGRRFGSLPTLAIAQATSLVVLLALGLATEGRLPITPSVAPQAAVYGLLASVAYITMFTGLAIGPLSVVSPSVAAYGGLTVVLSVLVLGETVASLQWVGVAIGTLGVALTALRFGGPARGPRPVSRGVALAIVALVLFASVTVGMAGPIRQAGWLDVIFVSRIANTLVVSTLLVVVRRFRPRGWHVLLGHPDRSAESSRWAIGIVVGVGILDVTGFIAFAIGLEVSLAWIVGLASSFGPAVAVVVAVAFLGERLRSIQWLGLLSIALGLVLIALPR